MRIETSTEHFFELPVVDTGRATDYHSGETGCQASTVPHENHLLQNH